MILAFIRLAGQVVMLRLGTASVHCTCPVCPAYTIMCSCHGAPQPGSTEYGGSGTAFLAGFVVGICGASVVVCGGRGVRRIVQCGHPGKGELEDLDERDRVQLEFRRLRK